jgi:hypothetical protein
MFLTQFVDLHHKHCTIGRAMTHNVVTHQNLNRKRFAKQIITNKKMTENNEPHKLSLTIKVDKKTGRHRACLKFIFLKSTLFRIDKPFLNQSFHSRVEPAGFWDRDHWCRDHRWHDDCTTIPRETIFKQTRRPRWWKGRYFIITDHFFMSNWFMFTSPFLCIPC